MRQTVLAALEHQDYPTLLLVERLRPPRDLSRPPLCQVMFVLDKPHRLTEQGTPAFVLGESGLRMNPGGSMLEVLPSGTSVGHSRPGDVDHRDARRIRSLSVRYNSDLFEPPPSLGSREILKPFCAVSS